MEYYLVRAMEVSRLSSPKLDTLHQKEISLNRCLMPTEIQTVFGLPTLKETWQIPEIETVQASHAMKLRSKFRELDLSPKFGDLSVTDPESVHNFDLKVMRLVENGELDLICSMPTSRSRVADSV